MAFGGFIGARHLVGAAGLRQDQHPAAVVFAECVRGVLLFIVFCIAPGGEKGVRYLFRKRPGHIVNAPGCFATLHNRNAPGGVY